MLVDGKKVFTCANIYQGKGAKFPVNACTYKSYSIPEGYRHAASDDTYFPMGSILGKK